MATTYLTLAGITGPLDPSATLTLPSSQPTGFGVVGSFGVQGTATGAENSGTAFLGGGAGAGKTLASPFMLYLDDTPAAGAIWQKLHSGQTLATACLVFTRPATGGIATRWVSSYWLLTNALVVSIRSSYSDGEPQAFLEVSLQAKAVRLRQFATPSGGQLGAAATDFTWNYATNTAT